MTTQTTADIGSDKITTLNTISTGVWNGSVVNVNAGGSGLSATTAYGLMCGGTTSTAALQSISPGTSTHALTSNGAGVLPSFQVVASGSTQIGATQTAANVATIDFTSMTGYDQYMIVGRNIVRSADGGTLCMRVSTDGGATWGSGAGFYFYETVYIVNATQSFQTSTSATFMATGGSAGNAANESRSIIAWVISPGDSGGLPTIITNSGYTDSSGNMSSAMGMGKYTAATAINAVQLLFDSGNIATGFFSMFGIK